MKFINILTKVINNNNKKILKYNILNENNNNEIKNLKKIINNKEKKKNYYNTINTNEIEHYPYGSINKEDAKVKIKQIDTDIVNIKDHRFFWKKKSSKSRQNIKVFNEYFNNDFLIEKYNQKKQANIIGKIIAEKNKEIQQKINMKKKLIKNKNYSTTKI